MNAKKLILMLAAFTLAFSLVITGCVKSPGSVKTDLNTGTYSQDIFNPKEDVKIKSFSSDADFLDFIKKNSAGQTYSYYGAGLRGGVMMDASMEKMVSSVAPITGADLPTMVNADEGDYSTTNNQVDGVDEADLMKTDGDYIYTITQNTLYIVKAYPGNESKVVSTLKLDGTPQGLFIQGNTIAVFGDFYNLDFFKTIDFVPRNGMTFFNIYDMTNKENVTLLKEYKFEGRYFQARMKDDFVYFVALSGMERRDYPTPLMFDGGIRTSMPVKDIFYYPIPYSYPQLASVHAIKIADTASQINSKSVVVEGASNMFMGDNLFITYTEYINEWKIRETITSDLMIEKLTESDKALVGKIKNTDNDVLSQAEKDSKIMQIIYSYMNYLSENERDVLQEEIDKKTEEKMKEYEYLEYTVINKITVNKGNIEIGGFGKVPGHVINQFSMDEKDNVFRIATTISQRWPIMFYKASYDIDANKPTESENQVHSLDKDLNNIGSLKGLAKGEQIYSTRFIGDRLYMVTFKQVDPFFVIDLSDPKNIKELGKLKIPGFSRYLHPYDENMIIGIGRDATESGRTGGLKISLFDVTDVENPKETAKFVTSEKYAQSTAEYEHKAFLMSKEKNILVIPAYNYDYDYMGKSGGQEYNGAMVFKITKDSITLKGIVDHSKNTQNYYGPLVERSLYIKELLYTKSPGLIRINTIDDLTSVNEVTLEENNQGPYKIV